MGAQWKEKGKALAADAKGKLFGKLVKDIMIAARAGADPKDNAKLRMVVEQARKVSMPQATRWSAPSRRARASRGETINYSSVVYEGFAPHRVPVVVECLTDNVNRTASEVRGLFRKGQLGTPGSVTWDYDHLGMIEAEPATPGADRRERRHRGRRAGSRSPATRKAPRCSTPTPADLDVVSKALPDHGFTVLSAKLGCKAKNPVDPSTLSAEALEEVRQLPGGDRRRTTTCRTSTRAWRAEPAS